MRQVVLVVSSSASYVQVVCRFDSRRIHHRLPYTPFRKMLTQIAGSVGSEWSLNCVWVLCWVTAPGAVPCHAEVSIQVTVPPLHTLHRVCMDGAICVYSVLPSPAGGPDQVWGSWSYTWPADGRIGVGVSCS